jgi:peptidoglycan/xylan/chitin deacetylase (PgdA/CDA1 family)
MTVRTRLTRPSCWRWQRRGTLNSRSLSLANASRRTRTFSADRFAEGHEIGNHSWSHPNLAKLSDADVRSQLQRTEDVIVKTAGIKPKLMRPPYGELTKRQRILVNHEFGYKVILWDVDPIDWKRPGPNVVAQRIIAGARPGSIILSHDIHPQRLRRCHKFLTPFSQKDSNS